MDDLTHKQCSAESSSEINRDSEAAQFYATGTTTLY